MMCEPGWLLSKESITGLRTCVPCAPNTLQPLPGQLSCVPCPDQGVDCTMQDRVQLYPGWFRPNTTQPNDENTSLDGDTIVNPVRCTIREGCLGGPNVSDASCAEGHEGPLCGACTEGYYMGARGCKTCEEQEGGSSIGLYVSCGALTVALLFCFFYVVEYKGLEKAQRASEADQRRSMGPAVGSGARHGAAGLCESALGRLRQWPQCDARVGMLLAQLSRRARSLGTTGKILLSLFQQLNSFRELRSIRWPDLFAKYLEWISPLSFDFLAALPIDCFVAKPLTLAQHIGAMMLMPLVGSAVIVIVAVLASRLTLNPRERGVRAVAMRPATITVQVWLVLILYPSMAKMFLLPFDCVTVGERRLLRSNPAEPCDEDSWYALAVLGGIGTVVYTVGVPFFMFLLTRYANQARKDAQKRGRESRVKASQRIGRARLLTHSYTDEFFYWESAETVRKFLLTAVVHVVEYDKPFQIYFFAFISCGYALLLFGRNSPYSNKFCGTISSMAAAQLVLTSMTGLLFYDGGDEGSPWWDNEQQKWGIILVVGNSLGFAWLFWGLGRAVNSSLDDAKSAVRSKATGKHMTLPPRELGINWHLFLSHSWETAQDQVRVIKERLNQLVPGISTFLDVDDLDDVSRLEDYIGATQTVVVFLSGGYVTSKNCLRELRAAVKQKKPLLVVREIEDKKGRITNEAVRESLKDEELLNALLGAPSIDWHRISVYQDLSLLQIIRQLVPEPERKDLYMPGGPLEQLEACALPPTSSAVPAHLYVSPHNQGANTLARELAQTFAAIGGERERGKRATKRLTRATRVPLNLMSDATAFESAGAMLLLLDKHTWNAAADDLSALTSKRSLAQDVSRAMRAGIKIIMAHECDFKTKLETCVPFSVLFDPTQTPPHLVAWGVYHDIAVALNGGEHRTVSLALLALNLVQALAAEREPRPDLQSQLHLVELPLRLPQPVAKQQSGAPQLAPPGPSAAQGAGGGPSSDDGESQSAAGPSVSEKKRGKMPKCTAIPGSEKIRGSSWASEGEWEIQEEDNLGSLTHHVVKLGKTHASMKMADAELREYTNVPEGSKSRPGREFTIRERSEVSTGSALSRDAAVIVPISNAPKEEQQTAKRPDGAVRV